MRMARSDKIGIARVNASFMGAEPKLSLSRNQSRLPDVHVESDPALARKLLSGGRCNKASLLLVLCGANSCAASDASARKSIATDAVVLFPDQPGFRKQSGGSFEGLLWS